MEATRLAAKKQEILENEGYRYSFDRQVYFNRKARKAFSVVFVEENTEEELLRLTREEVASSDWRFFFNTQPSDAVKRELVNVLA
jgi:hypothetical protein